MIQTKIIFSFSNFIVILVIIKTVNCADSSPNSIRTVLKGNCSNCCPINEKKDIAFLLFTRMNFKKAQRLRHGNVASLTKSNLQVDKPTIIYVHGFGEEGYGEGSTTIKNAYLKRGSFNVILLDWSLLTPSPPSPQDTASFYHQAVTNTRLVGFYLSRFIDFIVANGVPIKNIHLIGFSLGAHIVGLAGKNTTIKKLPRITGLDPAFPLFTSSEKEGRIASTDAEFVDVIHTDGGEYGFPDALGDVDYFPNGGVSMQPGCEVSKGHTNKTNEEIIICNHHRAWRFYAESILNEKGFPATRCTDYKTFLSGVCPLKIKDPRTNKSEIQYMGFIANPQLKGKYYLVTNSQEPFAKNFKNACY